MAIVLKPPPTSFILNLPVVQVKHVSGVDITLLTQLRDLTDGSSDRVDAISAQNSITDTSFNYAQGAAAAAVFAASFFLGRHVFDLSSRAERDNGSYDILVGDIQTRRIETGAVGEITAEEIDSLQVGEITAQRIGLGEITAQRVDVLGDQIVKAAQDHLKGKAKDEQATLKAGGWRPDGLDADPAALSQLKSLRAWVADSMSSEEIHELLGAVKEFDLAAAGSNSFVPTDAVRATMSKMLESTLKLDTEVDADFDSIVSLLTKADPISGFRADLVSELTTLVGSNTDGSNN